MTKKQKQLSEYDFTPDQQLITKENATSKDTPMSVKIFMLLLLLLVGLFFIGHALGIETDLFSIGFMDLVMTHIKEHPFDFLHFSTLPDLMLVLVWFCIGLIYLFPANSTPKAEMKGEEHGSNDFQNIEERKVFMKRCSTSINMLDVDMVKAYEEKHKKKEDD